MLRKNLFLATKKKTLSNQIKKKVKICRDVWFVFLNNYFQFLNIIIRIFLHFFIHTHFHKYFQITIFNFKAYILNGSLTFYISAVRAKILVNKCICKKCRHLSVGKMDFQALQISTIDDQLIRQRTSQLIRCTINYR